MSLRKKKNKKKVLSLHLKSEDLSSEQNSCKNETKVWGGEKTLCNFLACTSLHAQAWAWRPHQLLGILILISLSMQFTNLVVKRSMSHSPILLGSWNFMERLSYQNSVCCAPFSDKRHIGCRHHPCLY